MVRTEWDSSFLHFFHRDWQTYSSWRRFAFIIQHKLFVTFDAKLSNPKGELLGVRWKTRGVVPGAGLSNAKLFFTVNKGKMLSLGRWKHTALNVCNGYVLWFMWKPTNRTCYGTCVVDSSSDVMVFYIIYWWNYALLHPFQGYHEVITVFIYNLKWWLGLSLSLHLFFCLFVFNNECVCS